MRRRHYILIGAVALCIAALLYVFGRPPTTFQVTSPAEPAKIAKHETPSPTSTPLPSPPAPNPNLSQQETHEEKLRMIFSHSINFYGMVVDEQGVPVEGARVRYSVPSSFLEIQKGTVEGPVTDTKGMFSITGKRGAGIYVSVSHPDYYETDQSYRQFSYFENTADNPTPTSPAEFVLRRKGTAEPLLKLKQVVRSLPKDGRPVQVGLTGDKAGDMTLQAWTSPRPEGAPNNAPFAWKVRLAVPGGGLVAYKDEYQFEAPENGYAPGIEFEMPLAGIDGKWRDRFEQTYFVKLGNGNYARMRFQMVAGGNHFAVVESYYNPSGSRNLEYDPIKATSSNP